jgi:phage terminase large subunit-like protein
MAILQELIDYSNDVIAGKVIACQKHKWACMRFLRDIDRSAANDPAFPYEFNEAKAERFFTWMGLFKHRKGILKGKNIVAAPIQRFVFANIYGWIHRETKYRRFRKFYWQMARKNAKSQTLACVGTYELMAYDESGLEANEIYIAATKSEQAKIVYEEATSMLENCAMLKGKFLVAYGRITHKKSGSIMRALSEEDRKSGDGLNPQCGIIDEYHAHVDSEIYDIIDSGMGARAEPLLGIITTAGFELNNTCYRVEYDLISKILNPNIPVNIDSYFIMVNELDKDEEGKIIDDIKDENAWIKANPIICSYAEGKDYLRKKLEESLEAPEKMRNFLTKHMNLWVNQPESSYLNLDKWNVCKGTAPDLAGKACYIGLDLSAKIDLVSIGYEFPVEDKFYLYSHSFIPEETLERKRKTDKVPYDLWIQQGWISTTAGAAVDYRFVKDYMINYAKERHWDIAEICIDPWGAMAIQNDLIEDGFTVVEIIQGIKTLSEPTKNFREMVYQKRIVHDGNPLLTWAIGNAIADSIDRNENIILNKKKSRGRIDPIAAMINAHVRAIVAKKTTGGGVWFV